MAVYIIPINIRQGEMAVLVSGGSAEEDYLYDVFNPKTAEDESLEEIKRLIVTSYCKKEEGLCGDNPRISSIDELRNLGNGKCITAVIRLRATHELLATVSFYLRSDNYIMVSLLAVHCDYWGKGIGTKILVYGEHQASIRFPDSEAFILESIQDVGNESYYHKRGYRTISTKRVPIGTWSSVAPFTMATMIKSTTEYRT